MSSHNERIAAMRQQTCADFAQVTSTNLSTAKHYLRQTAFDLERAVSLFYEAGGAPLPPDDEGEGAPDEGQPDQNPTQEDSPDDARADAEDGDPISAILNAARKEAPPDGSPPATTSFGGRGFSLSSPSASLNDGAVSRDDEVTLKVRVTFYRDGFTDQEEKESGAEKEQRQGAVSRRWGVHSLSSSSSSDSRLPPRRAYEDNAQFIRDVQDSRVPVKYRRRDERNRPVLVSILLDDQRKRDYPMEIWRRQQREERSAQSFGGPGQTLGGEGGPSDTPPTSNNNSLGAWLLVWLLSWWGVLCTLIARWMSHATAAPLELHAVDRGRATTAIVLRLPDKKRERVEFNVHHTVADLRRHCCWALEGAPEDRLELLAGFPPKTVRRERDGDTLEEAGLLNSAVDVRVLSNLVDKRQN